MIAQAFVDGLSFSAILLIVALGLAITFGVMKVINLAHGELIMIGAYTAYVVTTLFNLPYMLAIMAAFCTAALVGMLMEIIVIKRLYGRPLETLLATVGISIILQEVVRLLFGTVAKSVVAPFGQSISIGGIIVPYYRLFVILFSILLVVALVLLLYKTRFGMQLRSVSQNREMSQCLGINTSVIDTLTFALGSGLAGIAGAIIAPMRTVSPTMGSEYLMDSFMVVVLGGVGSIAGTNLGALIIGEANQLLTTLGTATFAKFMIFVLIIITIRFRPEGLLSSGGRQ